MIYEKENATDQFPLPFGEREYQTKRFPGNQRGFVLIVTLWVMVMLGVIVTTLAYQVRVEASVERWSLNQSRLRWAARGGVHLAGAQLREHAVDDYHSPYDEWWSDESLWQDLKVGDAVVSLLRPNSDNASDQTENENTDSEQNSVDTDHSYGPDDEESRLNINIAEPENLIFPGVSSVLAEAIVSYRRELQEDDEEQNDDNANDETDEADGENQTRLVQGPIHSLRQLLEVEGVTEELLFTGNDEQPPLAQYLTTVSSGKINVNSAPEAVLTAAGLNEGRVNSIVSRRDEEPFESLEQVKQAINVEEDPDKWQQLEKILDVRSTTFRLLAQATLPELAQTYQVQATLHNSGEALMFIRWQEY